MNIREQLLIEHSKSNALLIRDYVGEDVHRFKKLMECFFDPEYRVAQRAAHSVAHVFDAHPNMVEPYLSKMVQKLLEPDLKVALKRNIVRILQFVELEDQELLGKVIDRCFQFLLDPKETIAVQAFSIELIVNASKKYPELKQELVVCIKTLSELQPLSKGMMSKVVKYDLGA